MTRLGSVEHCLSLDQNLEETSLRIRVDELIAKWRLVDIKRGGREPIPGKGDASICASDRQVWTRVDIEMEY